MRQADGASIPLSDENADYRAYLEWAETNQADQPPGPTIEERAAVHLAAVDAHLNAAAKAKGYDSIVTAAHRAGYPGPFHDEGVAFATWMDATYQQCYALLAQVQAGEAAEPTPAELIAMLPTLKLPS
ncbi:hypothetical protein [Variovorax ginsengisoli]|uniref:Uncharacterized protein n=1 Tax=Variovorax ginsengisoli TaxID=363844 RepID=A0ABT8SDV1_9BURK|nr:hypothetical protein [Variovorax ginsengisoli]MDN8617012.1 hypothetical protein [Variovorax ginsengisoli]MDO1536182.1 hypothetical protein [Variovorax ginsengisoli]